MRTLYLLGSLALALSLLVVKSPAAGNASPATTATGRAASSPSATTTAQATSPEAQKILAAIQLWKNGSTDKAIEILTSIDWRCDIRFGSDVHFLTMTERQLVALPQPQKQKIIELVLSQLQDCRAMARELVDRAKKARASGNDAQALKYLATGRRLGELLDRDKDMMLIVRLVGIAIQKSALTEELSIYQERDDKAKLEDVQQRLKELDEQTQEIRSQVGRASGG
jgi:hypothetical protein